MASSEVIAVLSDTHGVLRPEVRAALAGVEQALHAGDFDDVATLRWLLSLATVSAVRGNCDRGGWADALPRERVVTIADRTIYIIHDLGQMDLDPKHAGFDAVVFGHTHVPTNEVRDGVLFFNPGSAGPRRYGKPVTMGELHVGPGGVSGRIVTLAASGDHPQP